jgi:hypothetical protein
VSYVFCTVTLARHEQALRLARQAAEQRPAPAEICVVNNGEPFPWPRRLDGVPLTVVAPGHNLGVAASWNLCGTLYRPIDIVISNDDAVLEPGECARLLAQDAPLVTSGGWWRFLIRERAWERFGRFDENIWPAYFEETDWRLRGIEAEGLADLPDLLRSHLPHKLRDEGGFNTGVDHFGYSPESYERQTHYVLDKWHKPSEVDPDTPHHEIRRVLEDRAADDTGHCEDPERERSIEWEFGWQVRLAGRQGADGGLLVRLRELASDCSTVSAIGARNLGPLTALLAAHPDSLTCYDAEFRPETDALFHFRGRTAVRLVRVALDRLDIEPTELLYIDDGMPLPSSLKPVSGRVVLPAASADPNPPDGWIPEPAGGLAVWRR